jgi:hypothetical protein
MGAEAAVLELPEQELGDPEARDVHLAQGRGHFDPQALADRASEERLQIGLSGDVVEPLRQDLDDVEAVAKDSGDVTEAGVCVDGLPDIEDRVDLVSEKSRQVAE